MPLSVGTRLGNYEIVTLLGEDGSDLRKGLSRATAAVQGHCDLAGDRSGALSPAWLTPAAGALS